MQSKPFFTLLAFCVVATSADQAAAGLILNPADDGLSQVQFSEPIGNSFTAEDPLVSAAFSFGPQNPSFDPTDPVLFQLFDGVGTGGPLLFGQSYVIPGTHSGFFDVDLSSVTLTPGNDYSFVASIDGNSPYWGINRSISGVVGVPINSGVAAPGQLRYALRVAPVAVNPIPEPTSLAIFGTSALGLLGIRRRKKRASRQSQ